VNAKHFEPINVRAQQWAHAQPHNEVTRVLARWQSGLETLPRLRCTQVAAGVRGLPLTGNYEC